MSYFTARNLSRLNHPRSASQNERHAGAVDEAFSNHITALDTAMTLLFHVETHWRRARQRER